LNDGQVGSGRLLSAWRLRPDHVDTSAHETSTRRRVRTNSSRSWRRARSARCNFSSWREMSRSGVSPSSRPPQT